MAFLYQEPRAALLRRRGQPRAFSLVVTVSMMILLSLLAIGLLSLSTISLRTSRSGVAVAEARANARLALMLAIGDLQKAAGPDQRVTATADIAGTAEGDPLPAGGQPANVAGLDGAMKGLSAVQPGTRYWTGVFRNQDDPEQIYSKTPTAGLSRWLVSSTPGSDTTPADPAYSVNSDGSVSDPDQAVVLVGENTLGNGPSSLDGYVAAPLVPVVDEDGQTGSYAYWIGDEGVKARLDMEQVVDEPDRYASLVPQRRGWETVEGFSDYPLPQGDADSGLVRIASYPSSELLIPSLGGGNPSPLQSSFHSATVASRGLIVDTLDGGTRIDLSSLFNQGLPSEPPAQAYDNYPVARGRVIPAAASRTLRQLRWEQIEEFYKLPEQLDSGALKVEERESASSAAIAPIVIDFRILMGMRLVDPSGGSGSRFRVHPCGKVAIAIANPYSVPIEWDEDLEFEIKNTTPLGNLPSRIWQLGNNCAYIPSDGTAERAGREPAVFNQAVFTIGKDRLEPGEARAYTLGGAVVRRANTANRRQEVDLSPFDSSQPYDFNSSIEMETTTEVSLPITVDVRESWQTTRVMLEMRLAGSRGRYAWLRRIEGFELDNGYFAPNQRTFTLSDARRMQTEGAVPLMLYSFQISQPGMDYLKLMPAGYEMGQRGSTLRTFTDFNLRATVFSKPITSYNPPPFFMESNDSYGLLPFRPAGQTGTGFTRNLAFTPLNWGYSSVSGSTSTVLFSVPRDFVSLAQLQHADLTNDDDDLSIGHQPGNAFANSYATPFVRRASVVQERTDYILMGSNNTSGAQQIQRNYYDISHLLNSSLWDRYFFSSTPYGGGKRENPTLIAAPGSLQQDDPVEAAAALMIDGAFNINSTDPRAWKAFLASARYFEHSSGGAPEAAFPRALDQPAAAQVPPTGTDDDSFSGFRRLSDDELEDLSQEIARQVRRRGPFVSLSHFVNRALADINDDRELTRCGALQFALDESGINISGDGRKSGFLGISGRRDQVTLVEKQGAPRADLDGGDTSHRPSDANSREPDWARTSRDNNFGAVASIIADRELLSNRRMQVEQGFRSTGIPGWVTQADVLQVIGPAISARSDTFRIRTYGEARDQNDRVVARAFCEATVQRQPGYVDPGDAPYERAEELNAANQTYGRRFELVSFRWLSPTEI